MPRDERLELGNELCRPPGREICLDALLERMDDGNLTTFPVTTPDGKLVGLVLRKDAEAVSAASS